MELVDEFEIVELGDDILIISVLELVASRRRNVSVMDEHAMPTATTHLSRDRVAQNAIQFAQILLNHYIVARPPKATWCAEVR